MPSKSHRPYAFEIQGVTLRTNAVRFKARLAMISDVLLPVSIWRGEARAARDRNRSFTGVYVVAVPSSAAILAVVRKWRGGRYETDGVSTSRLKIKNPRVLANGGPT